MRGIDKEAVSPAEGPVMRTPPECSLGVLAHLARPATMQGSREPRDPGNLVITGAEVLITAPTGDQAVWSLSLLGSRK